jgi:hypothetical protein
VVLDQAGLPPRYLRLPRGVITESDELIRPWMTKMADTAQGSASTRTATNTRQSVPLTQLSRKSAGGYLNSV